MVEKIVIKSGGEIGQTLYRVDEIGSTTKFSQNSSYKFESCPDYNLGGNYGDETQLKDKQLRKNSRVTKRY